MPITGHRALEREIICDLGFPAHALRNAVALWRYLDPAATPTEATLAIRNHVATSSGDTPVCRVARRAATPDDAIRRWLAGER